MGTSNRQGASSITQLEIMPKPPSHENKALSWPHWPMKLRTSSSHEEGCDRHWSVTVTGFRGYEGKVTGLNLVKVGTDLKPITGSEFSLDCDLVLLAMGFVHPIKEGLTLAVAMAATAAARQDTKREDAYPGNVQYHQHGTSARTTTASLARLCI